MPMSHLNLTEVRRYTTGATAGGDARLAYMGSVPILAFGTFGNHVSGLEALTSEQADGGFVPSPTNLSELVDNSLRAMLPTIKAELSLINSVIELKDFRSLPKTLKSMTEFTVSLPQRVAGAVKTLRQGQGDLISRYRKQFPLWQRIRNTFSGNLGPTLAEATRIGADGYLQAQFNILPLLSDIAGLTTAITRTRGRINDLVSRQGKRRMKHFTLLVPKPLSSMPSQTVGPYAMNASTFQGSVNPPGETGIYRNPLNSVIGTRTVAEYYSVFHAQVEYNYRFTQFQAEHAQLLGFMDAIGVNLNPAIIWNAIPWTFVVDWVFDISRWLDRHKTLNMEPVTNITRYLWSYKTTRRVRFAVKGNPNDNLQGGPKFHGCYLPDLYEVAYRRDVGIPANNSLITSELTLKKLTLGLALALTSNRRFHKRG
jgi:hypothetical protein